MKTYVPLPLLVCMLIFSGILPTSKGSASTIPFPSPTWSLLLFKAKIPLACMNKCTLRVLQYSPNTTTLPKDHHAPLSPVNTFSFILADDTYTAHIECAPSPGNPTAYDGNCTPPPPFQLWPISSLENNTANHTRVTYTIKNAHHKKKGTIDPMHMPMYMYPSTISIRRPPIGNSRSNVVCRACGNTIIVRLISLLWIITCPFCTYWMFTSSKSS